MGPPGVPGVTISGPNRGIFSKLNWPGPFGSGGHSHTIFSNGRFQCAQRSFGGDVLGTKGQGRFLGFHGLNSPRASSMAYVEI